MNQAFITSNKHTLMPPKTASHSASRSWYGKCRATGLYNSIIGVGYIGRLKAGTKSLAYGGVTLRVTDFLLAPLMVSKNLLKRASGAGTISARFLELGPSSLSERLVAARENFMSHTRAGVT